MKPYGAKALSSSALSRSALPRAKPHLPRWMAWVACSSVPVTMCAAWPADMRKSGVPLAPVSASCGTCRHARPVHAGRNAHGRGLGPARRRTGQRPRRSAALCPHRTQAEIRGRNRWRVAFRGQSWTSTNSALTHPTRAAAKACSSETEGSLCHCRISNRESLPQRRRQAAPPALSA